MDMNESPILKVDTIEQYNNLFDFETRHPQVNFVDFDTVESQKPYRMTVGFYSSLYDKLRKDQI